jgi:hypothetical protein
MESIEAQHEEVVASPPQEREESVRSPQVQVESAAKSSIPEAEDKILEGTLDRASSLVDEDSASADLFLDNEAAQQEESPVAPFKLESESVDMIPEGEKETPESPEDESLAVDLGPPDEDHKSAPIIPDVLSIEAQTPVKEGDPNFIEGLKLENSEEAKSIAPESVASEKLSPEPLEAEEVLPKEVLSEPQKVLPDEPSEENAHDEVKATEGQKVPPKEEPKNPEFTDTSMSDISLEGLSLDNLSLDSDPLQSDFSPDSSIAKLPPEADVQIDPGDELKLVSSGSGLMDEPPLELNDKVNPGESRVPDGAPDIKLARREPQESDYLEANSDYVGADAGSVVDPRSQVEEKAPFERFDGKAGLESPYAGTRPAGKPRAESSTAVIVNYLDDKEETPMVEEGEYGALGAEEDLDLDLLELNNPPSFKAKPMIPVPRAPR